MPRRQSPRDFAVNYAKKMLTDPKVKLSAVEYRRWFNLFCVLTNLIKIDIKDETPVQGKNIGDKDDLDTQAAEMLRRLGGDDATNTSISATSASSTTD